MKNKYSLIHRLHIYSGLIISPFILIFAFSALTYNHSKLLSLSGPVKPLPVIRLKLDTIPCDTTDLLTAKAIMRKLGIKGEIDFISKNETSISFPVNKPGLKTKIVADRLTDSVIISTRKEGSMRAMNWLHIMPGQHNAKVRGNSLFMKIWKLIADAVVYLIIFLTLTGLILWYWFKPERSTGLLIIILGVLYFAVMLFIIL